VFARRAAVLLLEVIGALLALAGVAGVLAGVLFAEWLHSRLPPVLIDAPAVGGAATASGVVLLILAGLHALGAIGLARSDQRSLTPVAALAAAMSLLALGWAVAALVTAASGSGPPALMLPAGIGLGLLAVAYALLVRWIIGRRQPPRTGT
jgi:hypothetical protein